MSENDGKIHTVYMRDPLKIKSQNLPYKKTDLYGEISRGFPGPCRALVLVEQSLLLGRADERIYRPGRAGPGRAQPNPAQPIEEKRKYEIAKIFGRPMADQ